MSTPPLPLIDPALLWSRLMEMATIGATDCKGEVDRPALSDRDAAACALLIDWGSQAGLSPSLDGAGNLFLEMPGQCSDLAPVMCGSHLDSQPTGGRFDGVLGVLAALEAARVIAPQRPKRGLIVVAWSNEEGSRFAPGMSGSAAFSGQRSLEEIRATLDHNGVRQGDAIDRFLGNFHNVRKVGLGREIGGYVELHIEQASLLEEADAVIGVVSGIQGKITWEIELSGTAAHAGTEPMHRRRDALASFVRISAALQAEIFNLAPDAMFTIGKLDISPNAPSVVPSRAVFRVDLRHGDAVTLNELARALERIVTEQASPCEARTQRLVVAPPNDFSLEMRKAIHTASDLRGLTAIELPSAAGHDARHLAAVTENAAMIFIPCRGGLSHHPDEWAEPAHVGAGAQVLCDILVGMCVSTS